MTELLGQQIKTSKAIENTIQQLLKQVMEVNNKIKGVKAASPEFTKHLADLCEEIHITRGRPLFYPFIGSGSGNGPYVELEDGSVKIDLVNGIGINILGHSHPKLIEASIRGSLEDVVMQGNLEPNLQYKNLSQKLVELASKNTKLEHVWLTTCGTMANENALKICRQKNSPAKLVVAMNKAFAGRSTLMAEVTDNPAYKEGLPTYNEVLRLDFYDHKDPSSGEKTLRQLKEHVANNKDNISCFTFEPMQGEGGYRVAPKEFFVPLLEFCKEQNIAVWADEVQTFCRTGELLASQTLGIGNYIDVVTVAKALQGGATLYTKDFNPKPGLIAGTFSGASASLSAGIAVLEELSENAYFGPTGKIKEINQYFVGGLSALAEGSCKELIHEPGGLGLMVAFTPHDGSKEKMMATLTAFFKNGLLTFGCGRDPYRIRFLIPANIQKDEMQEALKIIEKSLLETR